MLGFPKYVFFTGLKLFKQSKHKKKSILKSQNVEGELFLEEFEGKLVKAGDDEDLNVSSLCSNPDTIYYMCLSKIDLK